MSCCQRKRAGLARDRQLPFMPTRAATGGAMPAESPSSTFEYVGTHRLTLRGSATGAKYRFTFPGDRLEIAEDDVPAMLAEPDVRPVVTRSER